jgi:hypothetical protein
MKVLIATPVYGDTISTGCHLSILETIGFFAREFPHIEFQSRVLSTSFFPHARNALVSQFLNDESYSHLLFVDSDMGFTPELVAKMLAFGKPVVGAIYPEKSRSFDAFRRLLQSDSNTMRAQLASVDYVYGGDALVTTKGRDGVEEIEVIDGFVRVTRAGTGILLVAREAAEKIRDRFPELWTAEPTDWVRSTGHMSGGLLQCFAVIPSDDGVEIGADIAFSKRWVEGCGGEIWSCVDEAIIRTGSENYVGQFLGHLKVTETSERRVVERKSTPTA